MLVLLTHTNPTPSQLGKSLSHWVVPCQLSKKVGSIGLFPSGRAINSRAKFSRQGRGKLKAGCFNSCCCFFSACASICFNSLSFGVFFSGQSSGPRILDVHLGRKVRLLKSPSVTLCSVQSFVPLVPFLINSLFPLSSDSDWIGVFFCFFCFDASQVRGDRDLRGGQRRLEERRGPKTFSAAARGTAALVNGADSAQKAHLAMGR